MGEKLLYRTHLQHREVFAPLRADERRRERLRPAVRAEHRDLRHLSHDPSLGHGREDAPYDVVVGDDVPVSIPHDPGAVPFRDDDAALHRLSGQHREVDDVHDRARAALKQVHGSLLERGERGVRSERRGHLRERRTMERGGDVRERGRARRRRRGDGEEERGRRREHRSTRGGGGGGGGGDGGGRRRARRTLRSAANLVVVVGSAHVAIAISRLARYCYPADAADARGSAAARARRDARARRSERRPGARRARHRRRSARGEECATRSARENLSAL